MRFGAQLAKHFWLVPASTIIACSALAATTVSHLIAATALAESERPMRPARPTAVPAPAARLTSQTDNQSSALVARNIFCSACTPAGPVMAAQPLSSGSNPPATALPLRLVATSISPLEAGSFATIRNTTSAMQGAYVVGDRIPGAGAVIRIHPRHVDFENSSSHAVERIPMFAGEPVRPVAAPVPPIPAADRKRDARASREELLAAVDAGVRDLGGGRFEVDRALVAQVLANPSAASRGARVIPSVKNGKPDGFKLHAVRRNSVYSRIGFKSGDTIHAVNGFELTSMDMALDVYTKVRESSSLSVSITRGGKPMTLDYSIR
jgi:general secretion pathway protein C